MKIVTIGELLIDLTQTGVENGVAQYSANPGGAPANVAVSAALMGAETAFIGKVGDDSFGKMLCDTLFNKGVDVSGIVFSKEHKTTVAVVSVDKEGERSFSFYRNGCADVNLRKEELPVDLIKSADIFHFGSVSLTDEPCSTAIFEAVKLAKENGAMISYDPNYRPLLWTDEATATLKMRDLLTFVDIIKVSDEELCLLTDTNDLQAGADFLLSCGIKIVIVTLGENGAFFKTENAQGKVPAFKTQVTDTNGAGDTFFGTFLSCVTDFSSLCENRENSLFNAVKIACGAAGLSTTKSGAIPAMPDKAQTVEFIDSFSQS